MSVGDDKWESDQESLRRSAEQENAKIRNAYRAVFNSEPGKIVLKDLTDYFRWNHPAFDNPPFGTPYDPTCGAIRDGQHRVGLRIKNQLIEEAKEASNGPKPKGKVIKS